MTRPARSHDPDMPDDAGQEVENTHGRVVGRRGYVRHFGEWVPTTNYPDGGSLVHFGGPCGPLYVDKFGNS